jgi:F-type H+-transporting ATPase subunit b
LRTPTRKNRGRKGARQVPEKNDEFDEQREALLSKAKGEARAESQRLLEESRLAADALRAKQEDALKREQQSLNDEITRRTLEEVFAIARKTLTDLAGTSLEERMSEVFTRRLRELNDEAKKSLAKALKTLSDPVLVRSAFELPSEQRAAIQRALNETFSAEIANPFRDRARRDQRHRAHHEWTEGGVEHRGVSGVAGKRRRRAAEGEGQARSQNRAQAEVWG